MAQARKRTLSRGPNRRTLYGEKDSFHDCLRRAFARATWRSFPASRREDVDLRDSRSVRFRKAQTQDRRCMRNITVATAVPAASFKPSAIAEDRAGIGLGPIMSCQFR